jgi:hypothetical protein
MDHQEQHHLKHIKEREHEKKEHKAHEQQHEKDMLPFHPAWFVVIGTLLVVMAVGIWTFLW